MNQDFKEFIESLNTNDVQYREEMFSSSVFLNKKGCMHN